MDREEVARLVERLRTFAWRSQRGSRRRDNHNLAMEAADALEQSWPPSREQIAGVIGNSEMSREARLKMADAILSLKPEKPNAK